MVDSSRPHQDSPVGDSPANVTDVDLDDPATREAISGGRTEPSLPDRGFLGHPAGLGTLFNAELWERFSYYGMRAILAYYLYDTATNGGLGVEQSIALAIVATYGASVYLLSVLGGWLADRVIGAFKATLFGGIVIMAGHIFLSVPAEAFSWLGIAVVALGTGLQKASVSSVVGQLYDPQDGRRDSGFSIFYMSINIGSFFSPFVVTFLKDRWGYHAGFSAAAIGMALGLIGMFLFRKNLRGAGSRPTNPLTREEIPGVVRLVGGSAVVIAAVFGISFAVSADNPTAIINGVTALSIITALGVFVTMFKSPKVTARERSHLQAYVPLWIGAVLFWMIFEQAASKMAAFAADRTDLGEVFGIGVSAEFFQSVNPLFIVLLAPVTAALWMKRAGRFPGTGAKFSIGVLLAGLSFVLLAYYSHLWPSGPTAPMWALASVFVIQTIGELCLSPVGISATSKLAPAAFTTQSMALWFLASAVGQSAAAQAIRLMEGMGDTTFFLTLGLITAGFSLVLMALTPWIARHIKDVDERVTTA